MTRARLCVCGAFHEPCDEAKRREARLVLVRADPRIAAARVVTDEAWRAYQAASGDARRTKEKAWRAAVDEAGATFSAVHAEVIASEKSLPATSPSEST